jgi:hypothetical protein
MICRMSAVDVSSKLRYPAALCQNPVDHSLNSPRADTQEAHSLCCSHRLRHRWDLNCLRRCKLMLFCLSVDHYLRFLLPKSCVLLVPVFLIQPFESNECAYLWWLCMLFSRGFIPFSVAACIVYIFQAGTHCLGCHDFIHAAACMLDVDSQTEKNSLVIYICLLIWSDSPLREGELSGVSMNSQRRGRMC